jgi:anhydro-N-acetylmuramic acid kinase
MTGTSVDGIDAAILDFSSHPFKTIATHSHPIPEELKCILHGLCVPGDNEIERMGVADAWLGEVLAEATNKLIIKSGI